MFEFEFEFVAEEVGAGLSSLADGFSRLAKCTTEAGRLIYRLSTAEVQVTVRTGERKKSI